ncbi:MAG: transposase [Verrucomicrobiota bacterium]
MARKPGIVYAGAIYHVMCRGNRREAIFRDGRNSEMFLNTLEEVVGRCGWRVQVYVLMGNHYHMLRSWNGDCKKCCMRISNQIMRRNGGDYDGAGTLAATGNGIPQQCKPRGYGFPVAGR